MEFEISTFRIYERLLYSCAFGDNDGQFNGPNQNRSRCSTWKCCMIFNFLLLVGISVVFACLISLHVAYVGNPGCFQVALMDIAAKTVPLNATAALGLMGAAAAAAASSGMAGAGAEAAGRLLQSSGGSGSISGGNDTGSDYTTFFSQEDVFRIRIDWGSIGSPTNLLFAQGGVQRESNGGSSGSSPAPAAAVPHRRRLKGAAAFPLSDEEEEGAGGEESSAAAAAASAAAAAVTMPDAFDIEEALAVRRAAAAAAGPSGLLQRLLSGPMSFSSSSSSSAGASDAGFRSLATGWGASSAAGGPASSRHLSSSSSSLSSSSFSSSSSPYSSSSSCAQGALYSTSSSYLSLNDSSFVPDFLLSGAAEPVTMGQQRRAAHGYRVFNITLPARCAAASSAFDNVVTYSTFGFETVIINAAMASFPQWPGYILSAVTGEAWNWPSYASMRSSLIYPTAAGMFSSFLFRLLAFFQIGVSFFIISVVSAMLIRLLVGQGMVILYPLFFCMRRLCTSRDVAAMNFAPFRALNAAYPWLGTPMRYLGHAGRSSRAFLLAQLQFLAVGFVLYQMASLGVSSGLYAWKSYPGGLTLLIWALLLMVEYYSLLFVRSRGSILLFPKLILFYFYMFHIYYYVYPYAWYTAASFLLALLFIYTMILMVMRYEVKAFVRGEVSFESPRHYFVQLATPAAAGGALPEYWTLFQPPNRASESTYAVAVEERPGGGMPLPPGALQQLAAGGGIGAGAASGLPPRGALGPSTGGGGAGGGGGGGGRFVPPTVPGAAASGSSSSRSGGGGGGASSRHSSEEVALEDELRRQGLPPSAISMLTEELRRQQQQQGQGQGQGQRQTGSSSSQRPFPQGPGSHVGSAVAPILSETAVSSSFSSSSSSSSSSSQLDPATARQRRIAALSPPVPAASTGAAATAAGGGASSSSAALGSSSSAALRPLVMSEESQLEATDSLESGTGPFNTASRRPLLGLQAFHASQQDNN